VALPAIGAVSVVIEPLFPVVFVLAGLVVKVTGTEVARDTVATAPLAPIAGQAG